MTRPRALVGACLLLLVAACSAHESTSASTAVPPTGILVNREHLPAEYVTELRTQPSGPPECTTDMIYNGTMWVPDTICHTPTAEFPVPVVVEESWRFDVDNGGTRVSVFVDQPTYDEYDIGDEVTAEELVLVGGRSKHPVQVISEPAPDPRATTAGPMAP